jgi:hypothetical protein
MNDTISYGGEEYPITPMSLIEAIEVMFILVPYIEDMVKHEELIDITKSLLDQIRDNESIDLMRLLAHMLHTDAEKLISYKVTGAEAAIALSANIQINSIVELVNTAYILGISPIGWPDGS